MKTSQHRRALLKAGIASGVLWLPFGQGAFGARVKAVLPAQFDEVDHHEVPHRIRDGWRPEIPAPSSATEVVVVGGGISALTAAWRLADKRVVLLEKESQLGGNSRGREFNGCRHALGAFMNQGSMAPFEEFFRELAVPQVEIASQQHAWAGQGKIVRDPLGSGLGKLPWALGEQRSLAGAAKLMRSYLDPQEGIFFPRTENTEAIRALDRKTLWQHYENQKLTPRVKQLFDAVVSSRAGDSGEMLSAWMGSYLLSASMAKNYSLPGGHGAYAEALRSRIVAGGKADLRTGFTVIRVAEQKHGKVWVSGVNATGRVETIEADTVVMGVPKFYAKRIVAGLAEQRAGVYEQFSYNAYLVAQVHLRRRIDAPFETCAPEHFTRFIVAPDQLPGNQRRDGGGLLTAYIPFPRVAGRAQLFVADAKDLAERIVRDVESIFPAARGQVEGVQLHRWGHPMLTTRPGMEDALERARASHGRVAFAHSDSFGITGLYSAIWTGMDAEAEARAILMS